MSTPHEVARAGDERLDMGSGAIVLLFTTGSLWHWEIEGVRETGSADTRDAALFWAGWWCARHELRRALLEGKAIR